MSFFDDLTSWLQRNFAGSNPTAAANTLINQAAPPPDPAYSPAAAMAAGQPGARPLAPGETPGSLTPTPIQTPPPDMAGRQRADAVSKMGFDLMAAGQPQAAAFAPIAPSPVVHTPDATPNMLQSVFPVQPPAAPLARQQRRLRPGSSWGSNGQ